MKHPQNHLKHHQKHLKHHQKHSVQKYDGTINPSKKPLQIFPQRYKFWHRNIFRKVHKNLTTYSHTSTHLKAPLSKYMMVLTFINLQTGNTFQIFPQRSKFWHHNFFQHFSEKSVKIPTTCTHTKTDHLSCNHCPGIWQHYL